MRDGRRKTTAPAEMVMRNIKCYKCQNKGHISKYCPLGAKVKDEVGTVALSDHKEPESPSDSQVSKSAELLWSRVITEGGSSGGTREEPSLS